MSARRTLWLAALLAAAPAPAFAQDMCAALDRIADASRERVPFGSLGPAAREGTLVPGYREQDCTITLGVGVHCYRNLAPVSLEIDRLDRTLRDCLRREPVARPERRPPGYGERGLVFVAHGLRYRAYSYCNRSCRAGLIAGFDISLERSRGRPR